MFGQNPRRRPVKGSGLNLAVQKIFKTLQGEGPFAGQPAIFIRLGGCNLACPFCDTDFEDFSLVSTADIVKCALRLSTNLAGNNIVQLVVITGGEPLRQPVELLCQNLIDLNYVVQIETNGTLYLSQLPTKVKIICSPKAGLNGYTKIRADLLPSIAAIKFLVAKHLPPYDNIAEVGQSDYNIPVFIQPIDQNNPQLNAANTSLAVELALSFGHNLSLQLHKIIGIE